VAGADELVAGKVADAVAGGATRAHSVAAGLARVPEEAGVVLVHDAARPLATAEMIDRVLAGLVDADGAIPGVPVADTVKRVAQGRVEATLDRSSLVAVQTPQAFRADSLRAAYAGASDLGSATDCASVLEQAGLPVAVVDGDPRNIKVTTASDLERAEGELAR
jgi:2-C-methyl-D-erythritol 4-phosphate cytidylyltransferase